MGFDLTNERIQDTYEQLVQISGSVLVDGTGSAVTVDFTAVSASYATTASFALNAGANEWDDILNKPSGLVSSSAQIATDISGAFTSTSASIASDIATNKTDIATKLDSSTFTTFSSSVSSEIEVLDEQVALNVTRLNSLTTATSSYAVKTSDNTFSGTQTFNNIQVNGTGSFAVIESVTGSAKIIGDAYIVLNNNTPTERYAGVKVLDSGSTNNSASLEFDGQTNDWFYEYTDDGGATLEYGVVMFGPGYNTKGSHVYPTNNAILKGTGDHHIVTSSMTDDGSKVTVTGNLRTTGNVEGANAQSLGGSRRIALGNNNNVTADDAAAIGGESNSVGASYCATLGAASGQITSGDTSVIVGGYQNTIGGGMRNAILGGQSVTNNQNFSIVLGRESFTAPNEYTTYTANIDASGSATISGSITLTSEEVVNVSSGSATGSLVDNIHPAIASGSPAIKHIVTIDQTAYDTISGSGDVNNDTLYIISDAGDDVYPGNLQISGQIYSPVEAGTVASSTSSIDFNDSNFASLSLTSATFLANPSNLQSGTTYTIIFEQSGSHVSGYGDAFLFAGGTEPTLSDGKDILTMVSDGTNLYATALTDFS